MAGPICLVVYLKPNGAEIQMFVVGRMSALGGKADIGLCAAKSAFGGKADMTFCIANVCF